MPVSNPISVYADITKGCIFFDGSTVSPKFLGTVVASAHPTEADRVVIQRTDRLERDGITFRRMFKRMRINRLTNEDGVYLADAVVDGGLGYTRTQVVDYINGQSAERIDPNEAQYLGVWDADTNTPDLSTSTPSPGDFYFVGVAGTTLLDGINEWDLNDRVSYNGTAWEKIPALRLFSGTNRSVLLNTNASHYADGEAATGDPLHRAPGWYYKNTENNKINWHIFGDNQNIDYDLGDFGGFYAVIDFRNLTSAPFFTIHTTQEEDGLDAGVNYRSRVHYFDASAVNAALVAGANQTPAETRFLVHSADLTGTDLAAIEPTLTRIPLAVDSEATEGPQNPTEEIYLMTISTRENLAAGTEEFVVEKVGYQNGDVRHEYQLSSPPTTNASITADTPETLDFRRDATDTTILLDDGRQYGVNSIHAVDNGNGTIDILAKPGDQIIYDDLDYSNLTITGGPAGSNASAAANALNALFQVTPLGAGGQYAPTYPLLEGEDTTPATGAPVEGQVPTTTKSDGTTLHYYSRLSDSTGHGARYWSSETIDLAGEYYTVRITGNGRFMLGFADGSTDVVGVAGTADDIEQLQNNGGSAHNGLVWAQAFYDYGSYTAPWTWYGSSSSGSYGPGWSGATTGMMRYNDDVQQALATAGNSDGALFKVGINENGYMAVWYFDSGRSNDWIMTSRRSVTTDGSKDYHLVVKLWDGNTTLVEIPQRVAADPEAPALTYRYIESPDGEFYYPLFASTEEAEYVDKLATGNALGIAHTHIFVDEPTNSTWYMPATGGVHAGPSAPVNTAEITYSVIPTLADALYAPAQLTLQNQTAAENAAVNIQIIPQDTIATVSGLPTGLNYGAGYITGTTPYVAEDTDYIITVERSNNYGTTSQTFTLTITDNASLGDFTGFTGYGGNLVQPNRMILTDDALVQYDTVLSEDQQITWSYSAGALPPSIGILSDAGATALAGLNGNTLGSTGYDFAQTSMWDLRFVTFGGDIGGSGEKFTLTGWEDNATINGVQGTNLDVEFKLAYELDLQHGSNHNLVLYRDGVEVLRSAGHYSGDQTITLAAFDDQPQSDVYVPANWTITNIGAGSTTPPTGFADPLLEGTMGATTLLGDGTNVDAAAQFTQQLEVNHRYVFPQTWVEANILPYVQDDANDVYVGVPEPSVSWSDVGTGDFDAMFKLEGTANTSHVSKIKVDPLSGDSFNVNSLTDAFYDYALEWDGEDLHVIACNIGDINTQPGVSNGGSFSRVMTYTGYGTASGLSGQPLNVVIAIDNGGQANLTTAGLQHIRIPFGGNDILVGESSNGNGQFSALQPAGSLFDVNNGGHAPSTFTYAAPTLNAGYTYRFVYHASMESGDYIEFRRADTGAVYNTGVTTFGSGDPAFVGNYKGIEFAVPTDAPPLRAYFYNTYQSGYFDAGRELPISGSTYVVPVTGITLEGPAANQTGTVLVNGTQKHGWISLNEQQSAGERLVLDNAFFTDLLADLPDYYEFAIGLKGDSWANTQKTSGSNTVVSGIFKGDAYLSVRRTTSNNIYIKAYANGSSTSEMLVNTAGLHATVCAFIDVTSSGNNIRIGFGRNSNLSVTAGDESTVAYGDWSSYKVQTGDQGYGITSLDVMVQLYNSWTGSNFDGADVDWTGISEISIPQPAATMTTPWTKALDFSGSSERAQMVSTSTSHNPIMMGGVSTTVAAPSVTGQTSNDSNTRPWATAVVFSSDNNNSNQHIWNLGEGAGSNDDNIYLRLDAIGNLYFGWGRSGALNECALGNTSSGTWHGVYIAHTGERLSGANATAANLADCFSIRRMFSSNSFSTLGAELSTSGNWITTGGRMDRQFTGAMTVGGRGSNRSFHGKVASMVVTTLKKGVAMPTDAEISMMVRDPQQWLTDYKVGQTYRLPAGDATYGPFYLNQSGPAYGTQVWLMGDGPNDAYAQIRNDVYPGIQNVYPLNMVSMVSNDIQTVNIPGLT